MPLLIAANDKGRLKGIVWERQTPIVMAPCVATTKQPPLPHPARAPIHVQIKVLLMKDCHMGY